VLPGFTSNLYLVSPTLILVGLFNSLFLVAGWTLAQTLTPSELRGRVVSARLTVSFGALALGNVLGGALLLVFSYRTLWILAGVAIAGSSLFIWIPREARSQT
jgi:MFS family permease